LAESPEAPRFKMPDDACDARFPRVASRIGGYTDRMTDETDEHRLQKIESHLAHLERHYEELNQVIIEQGRLLRRLQAQSQRLTESIETAELDRIKSTNAKPPHYQ
jgi:uncharacterized coiled-coil protein SlyX